MRRQAYIPIALSLVVALVALGETARRIGRSVAVSAEVLPTCAIGTRSIADPHCAVVRRGPEVIPASAGGQAPSHSLTATDESIVRYDF